MSRDHCFETAFLDTAVETAQRLTGIFPGAYPARVRHRLEIGSQRYPDEAWRTRDNLKELCEEPGDVAGYALFELQQLRANDPHGIYDEQHLDLLAASAYAAIADWYALRAYRRARGIE